MPDLHDNESYRTVVLEDEGLRQFAGGFTAVPNRVLENNGITLGARMTYAMLLKYAWQKNFCFPAQETIARDLAVTDRSVRTFLKELREKGLITWKRQGLNRPNVYYILKLPDLTPPSADRPSEPEEFSAPDRKRPSVHERKHASGEEYSEKKTQSNDTVRKPLSSERQPARPVVRSSDGISWLAIQRTYGISEDDLGRVAYLVELQQRVLGQADRNLGLYVQRAAEAVRDQTDWPLEDHLARAAEDFARKPPRTTRSQAFHGRWQNVLEERSQRGERVDDLRAIREGAEQVAEAMSLGSRRSSLSDEQRRAD